MKGSYPVEYAQRRACLSIHHQVEMETQDHRAPNALNPKPVPANFVCGHPRYSRPRHTLDCHLDSKPHVVDFFDKVLPGIADGCWEYMFGPQYVHMLGPQLSHQIWTLCMQFARLIATLDVEAVPARDGDPLPTFQSLLPLSPAVGTTSRSVDGSCTWVARMLSPLYVEVVTFPPAGASPKEATPRNHRGDTFNCKRPWTLLTKTMGRPHGHMHNHYPQSTQSRTTQTKCWTVVEDRHHYVYNLAWRCCGLPFAGVCGGSCRLCS